MMQAVPPLAGDDIYIGLVRAIGTDLQHAVESLRVAFLKAGYSRSNFVVFKLSRFFDELLRLAASNPQNRVEPATIPGLSSDGEGRYAYYRSRMDAGDWLRSNFEASILAQRAVVAVADKRRELQSTSNVDRGTVFVFDSIMHPDEAQVLRAVYGDRFFLIAVHSTAEDRAARLREELRVGHPGFATAAKPGDAPDVANAKSAERDERLEAECQQRVDELMQRDEGLSDPNAASAPPDRRVAIRRTFASADVFVALPATTAQPGVIQRLVDKLFSEPFHTPTRDELGMAHAYVAARRSASLARTVGAAICTQEGDVIAVGVNDVPAPGGGHYWPGYDGGEADGREHVYKWSRHGDEFDGVDPNDQIKVDLFRDVIMKVFASLSQQDVEAGKQLDLLNELKNDPEAVVARLLKDDQVRSTQFFDVIEYSRSLHAEMSALITCARLGVSARGGVLYCTTFPCHECSRLIIGAGISRVVYVEPYAKSRVGELHADAVEIERFTGVAATSDGRENSDRRVHFEPFIGFSPDRHGQLYSWVDRKIDGKVEDPNQLGRKRHWQLGPDQPLRPSVRPRLSMARLADETAILASEKMLEGALQNAGLLAEADAKNREDVTPLQ